MLKLATVALKKMQNSFVLQQDHSDCGVACLLSLIQYYDGAQSLEKLRELSGTTKQGTTLLGLFQAANQLGFKASGNEADLQAIIDHPEPLILHVVIEERLEHYVVCYGYKDGLFIIGDPAKGIVNYTGEQLEKIWKSKTCLTLSPNQDFVTTAIKKSAQKEWFIKLLQEDYRIISFSVVLGLGISLLGMAMAVFSQKLIDDILPSKDFTKLITGIVLVALLLLIRVVFSTLRDYFLMVQSKDFNKRITDSFYTALLNLPKIFFDTRKIGDLVARLNDTQRVQNVINQVVGGVVINTLVTIVSLGFLFFYSWETGLIALFSLPFYFILIYMFNTRIINAQKNVMRGYAFSESNYITSMQGIATIKNFNRQHVFKKVNELIYGNFQERVFDLGKINLRLSVFSSVFSVLFLISVLVFTSIQVFNGSLLLGELMAVLGIAGSLLPAIAGLALITIPINEAKVAFNRMYEFASIPSEITGHEKIVMLKTLEVKDLSFRFAGRSKLLHAINLSLKQNECIAIVGESGSGKSTLGQILQKFYQFDSGSILLNDHITLDNVLTADWRDILSVVPQDVTIFSGNVIDNILLGKEESSENILSFFKQYDFDVFLETLPQGYATILGEEGINLSGGQKQVIALMRALYKKPQILLLDEFTSAMDRKTEKLVLQLLNILKSELSIIFISHRLHSLPQIADRIYVLEGGTISHHGTHKELCKTANFYSDFWLELKQ